MQPPGYGQQPGPAPGVAPGPPTQLAPLPPHPKELEARLHLHGDPGAIRHHLFGMLSQTGWNVQWDPTGWGGMATQGDKTSAAFLGALSPYHEVFLSIIANPDGTTSLVIYRTGSGCMGGLIGVYQVRKAFRQTTQNLEMGFSSMGMLLSSGGR